MVRDDLRCKGMNAGSGPAVAFQELGSPVLLAKYRIDGLAESKEKAGRDLTHSRLGAVTVWAA